MPAPSFPPVDVIAIGLESDDLTRIDCAERHVAAAERIVHVIDREIAEA